MLTKNKKSYAGNVLAKEGRIYNTPDFDLKGISIKKTSTPKPARIFFSNLLEDKILNSPVVNIRDIYSMYHDYTKEIENSVKKGKPGYLKAGTMKSIDMYKNPYTLQSVRAALYWNALYGADNYISDFSTFKILSLDEKAIPPIEIEVGKALDFDKLYEELPEVAEELDGTDYDIDDVLKDNKGLKSYTIPVVEDNPDFFNFIEKNISKEAKDQLIELFKEHPDLKKYGLTVLAVPFSVTEIPSEFLPYTNVGEITNAVMKKGNILLESLGFILVTSRNRSIVSNMIKI